MKKGKMRKPFTVLGIIVMALVLCSNEAFPWGWATHAYVNEQLYNRVGGKKGVFPANEIYGGIGPDFVNDLFQYPLERGYLADQTHNDPLGVWDAAKSGPAKALARGFVTHSETMAGSEFGADSTAHTTGLTTAGGEAYIIAKAENLAAILGPFLAKRGLPLPQDVVIDISHEIVESALDIALTQYVDPSIAQKMIDGAIRRSGVFPKLLTEAYGQGFSEAFALTEEEAASFIRNAERQFRKSVVFYGHALTRDVETAVELLSEQKADVAENYLKLIAPELAVERAALVDLAKGAFWISLTDETIIDIPEFLGEIGATIDFVEGNLTAEGIDY